MGYMRRGTDGIMIVKYYGLQYHQLGEKRKTLLTLNHVLFR